jgi:hypothetical protein
MLNVYAVHPLKNLVNLHTLYLRKYREKKYIYLNLGSLHHKKKMRAVKIREHLVINSLHGSLVERPYSTRWARVQSQANTLYLNWAPSPSLDENKGG